MNCVIPNSWQPKHAECTLKTCVLDISPKSNCCFIALVTHRAGKMKWTLNSRYCSLSIHGPTGSFGQRCSRPHDYCLNT